MNPSPAGRRALRAAALALVTLPTTAVASAQTADLTVDRIDVVQVVPGASLVARKSTFVRAFVGVNGALEAGTRVDGLLRVYVDGAEASFSPIFSDNGPFEPPATIDPKQEDHTLNFVFLPPTSNDVNLVVEINPPGPNRVAETDYSNNVTSNGSRPFACKRRPEIVYVPIDYRPSGGSNPNVPAAAVIEPGAGDNFVQGIFPTGDWDYRRSDAPSKLWTNSLSGTGSGLLQSLLVDLNMMSPQPDFIYGWVPGSLPYNGQANGVPGKAGMGNTEAVRYQRTFAHELGHLHGRNHINNTISATGVDVERHLNLPLGLQRVMLPSKYDVMVAGLQTVQAWCYDVNFEFYFNRPLYDCGAGRQPASRSPLLLVGGLWDRAADTIELIDTVAFRGGAPTATVPADVADLLVHVWIDGARRTFGLPVRTPENCGDPTLGEHRLAPFVLVLPESVDPDAVQRLEVVPSGASRPLATLERSASAPQVTLVSPRRPTVSGSTLQVEVEATDADGDELLHYLRYSPDGERLVPLATASVEPRFTIDWTGLPGLVPDRGWFEVLTTDGLHTTRVTTGPLSTLAQQRGSAVNPPTTHVLAPDDGFTYPRGAMVVLHSSGWDLEDRAIRGPGLVWTSDLDGVLGNGRLLTVADLSVGTHVLTVTATDSGGLTASDSVSITVTDRGLPFEAAVLTRNGGSNPASYVAATPVLGTTWTADVDLTTTGHSSAQVLGYLNSADVTLSGGQVLLVGGPKLFQLPLTAGPVASWSAPLPNDPALVGLTVFTQAAHLGGVTPYALSNAQDLVLGN